MELLPIGSLMLPASVLLLLTLLVFRLRQRSGNRSGSRGNTGRDALDTVAAWAPEAARICTTHERQAHDLLCRAMPGHLVLAQVPLSRFIRVPTRHSYSDWLQRVGALSADLLLCDADSRVLAVVDVRAPQESDRSRRRHERMARVLRAAGVHVYTWREGELPAVTEVRGALTALLNNATPGARTAAAGPLIPVAEVSEMAGLDGIAGILAAGDRAALEAAADAQMEPVPSGFYDDLEPAGAAR